jgi:alpha-1,3-rhamnosyl/mannosyltransferase
MRFSFNALLLRSDAAGIGTLIRGLLHGLGDVGASHEWVVYLRPGVSKAVELPRWEGCRYVEIPGARMKAGRVAMELFGLPAYDRRFGVDVAYSPTSYLPLTQGVPAVATVVDFCWLRVPHAVPGWRRLSLRLRMERSLLRAAGIATISETMRRELLARYGAQLRAPVCATPLGVGPAFFAARALPQTGARARYGAAGTLILASGGTDPRKDVESLVRACKLLPREILQDARVMVIGPRSRRAEQAILSAVNEEVASKIRFTGFIPLAEVLELFACASLFVYSTLDEGFGLPVLEAMAAGVPVVCSDLEVLREVGGDTVIYTPMRDPAALARMMLIPLLDRALAEDLAARARERAATFTWARTAERLLTLFAQTLAGMDAAARPA